MHKYRPFLHMLLILMFLLQVVSATPQSHGTQGEDGSAAGVAPAPTAIATPGTGQIPLGGQPRPIPGVVEAEFYDIGGEGVAYHDTTPGNTGGEYRSDDVDLEYKDGANLNVGWGANGEWIEYTMDVAKGEYVIDARLACADSGRSLAVSMGGSVLATIDVPNTGAWSAPGNLSDMHVKMKRKHDDDRTTHPDAQWFYQAPMLGLFMHWGIVSAHPDTGAAWKFCPWPRMKGDLDINDLWAQVSTWNAADYDPYKWMSAAKDAGFKYAVLTVKHHDGYCLWPTKYGDLNTKVGPMALRLGSSSRDLIGTTKRSGARAITSPTMTTQKVRLMNS